MQTRRRFRIAGVVAGLTILWLAIGIVAWPRRDAIPMNDPPSVVIALGSTAPSDSTLDYAGTLRLARALEVARQLGARIVTTRGIWGDHTTDGGQRRMIEAAGLASRWTVLPGFATSTRDEVLKLRNALAGDARIAVVTSAAHTRRACSAFEHVGFRVTCVSAGEYRWWEVPYGFVYEQLATVKYLLKGWM